MTHPRARQGRVTNPLGTAWAGTCPQPQPPRHGFAHPPAAEGGGEVCRADVVRAPRGSVASRKLCGWRRAPKFAGGSWLEAAFLSHRGGEERRAQGGRRCPGVSVVRALRIRVGASPAQQERRVQPVPFPNLSLLCASCTNRDPLAAGEGDNPAQHPARSVLQPLFGSMAHAGCTWLLISAGAAAQPWFSGAPSAGNHCTSGVELHKKGAGVLGAGRALLHPGKSRGCGAWVPTEEISHPGVIGDGVGAAALAPAARFYLSVSPLGTRTGSEHGGRLGRPNWRPSQTVKRGECRGSTGGTARHSLAQHSTIWHGTARGAVRRASCGTHGGQNGGASTKPLLPRAWDGPLSTQPTRGCSAQHLVQHPGVRCVN